MYGDDNVKWIGEREKSRMDIYRAHGINKMTHKHIHMNMTFAFPLKIGNRTIYLIYDKFYIDKMGRIHAECKCMW